MSASDVLISVQELSGQWTCIGSGLARGIVVEDLSMDSDAWGPRSAQFVLKRNPQAIWPDISAFTPVEIEVGGIVVWEGRVKETPSKDGSDRQMSVSCEGWQYHLDDDSYQRRYVQTRLTDYVDIRSSLAADLTKYVTAGAVVVGDSGIVLTYPMGVLLPNPALCGVTLDFGLPGCKVVTFNWQSSNNSGSFTLLCDGHDNPDGAQSGSVETATSFTAASGASGSTGALTFTNPHRYVSFIFAGAFAGTLGVDVWMRINLAWTFGDSTYQSGNLSALKSSTVVADAKSRATLQLSSDTSKIQSTSFNIPDFSMSAPATPREAINAVNAYQAWQPRITRNKVLEYRPLPSSAIFEAAESGGIEFQDASANSGLDIYSGVNVTYIGPDGIAANVVRAQPASFFSQSAVQPTNPSFTVDTSSWAALAGAIARDTVVFDSTPGSLKMTCAAFAGGATTSAFTGGSVTPGRAYLLGFSIRGDTNLTTITVTVKDANGAILGTSVSTIGISPFVINTWFPLTLPVTFQTSGAPTISVSVACVTTPGTAIAWVDSLVLSDIAPTLVDRRGFKRTKILDTNMALTAAAAQQIGDVFLTGHKTTPFKGTINVNGASAIRLAQGGVAVPAAHLLYNTGELISLPHLIDPDTGGIGREGRIATVTCNPIQGTASIELDNTRSNFEALLSRLSIVTGQIAAPT